jgi:hypothetical protein
VNTILTIIIMTSLFGLVGCSEGGKTNTTLQVSRAFAMSNPYFGGGLIITGKNLNNGRTFSQGLTTSMQFSILLDKGIWLVSAVGWDGGTSSNVAFGGKPLCGTVTKNLENSTEVLELSVTEVGCRDTFFAAGNVEGVGTSIKKLSLINTCQTFFPSGVEATSNIATSLVQMGTADNFCDTTVSPDMKSNVESIKIFAQNKLLADAIPQLGFSSGCIQSNGTYKSVIQPGSSSPLNPFQIGNDLRLPYGGIPFTIVTYNDTTCTTPKAHYPFPNGLTEGDPAIFDHHLVQKGSQEMRLILPANDLRRALSPFAALLPSIVKYNGGSPIAFPLAPSSIPTNFHGYVGQNSIKIKNQSTCGALTNPVNMTGASCTPDEDGVNLSFTGTSSPASISIGGNNYTFYLAAAVADINRFQSQKLAIDLLGMSSTEATEEFFQLHDHDERDYGVLSVARNMLSGNGAGGVVGISNTAQTFETACLNTNVDKTVRIFDWEKMKLDTFRVVLHSNPVSAPIFFTCVTTNRDPASCGAGEDFHKRMMIYDYKTSAVLPAMVFEFNCSKKIGRLEINTSEIENLKRNDKNQIVSWNTEADSNYAYQRFENTLMEKGYLSTNSGWELREEKRVMNQVQKNGPEEFEAFDLSFEAHSNAGQFAQKMEHRRLITSSSYLYWFADNQATTNASIDYILSFGSFSPTYNRILNTNSTTHKIFMGSNFEQVVIAGVIGLSDFSTRYQDDYITQNLAALKETAFFNAFNTNFFTSP